MFLYRKSIMSDIGKLHRVVIEDTRRGRCAVCKRGSRHCSDVDACAQRSIPPLTMQYEPVSCKLCSLKVRGGDYSGHIDACLALYKRMVEDTIVGRAPTSPTGVGCSPGAAAAVINSRSRVRTATSVPAAAQSDRLTATRLSTSSLKQTGTIPKRDTESEGRPGKVSVGTQTTRKTCNASTMTKKMSLVPGIPCQYVRWTNKWHDLLDGISDTDGPQAEPLIPLPSIRKLDLLDLGDDGEDSLPIDKTSMKQEGVLVEFETEQRSQTRGREAAHPEVIIDNFGTGDNIVMQNAVDGAVDGTTAATGVVKADSERSTSFTSSDPQSSDEEADKFGISSIGDERRGAEVVDGGTTVKTLEPITVDVNAAEGAEEDGGSSLDTLVSELFESMGASKLPLRAAYCDVRK